MLIKEALPSAIVGVALAMAFHLFRQPESGSVSSSLGSQVVEIHDLQELVSVDVSIADVLTADCEDYEGAWLVEGDALISVDMGQAEFVEVDDERTSTVVRLPLPRVLHPRVNHEKTITYNFDSKRAWRRVDEAKVRKQALPQAQRLIEVAAGNAQYIDKAKKNTEDMIKDMYRFAGWSVEIQWVGHAGTGQGSTEEDTVEGEGAEAADILGVDVKHVRPRE